jgi:hypothetical protein
MVYDVKPYTTLAFFWFIACCVSIIQNIYPVIHVWRIQRVVRLFLRKKYEQRALALAMGQHARLGGELCAYACLPADLLALCVR